MKKTDGLGFKHFLGIFVVAVLCLAKADAGIASDYVPGELLIQPKAGVADETLDKILAGHNTTIIGEIQQIRVKHIKVPAHALEKVKLALSNNPHIEFIEYNYIAETYATPNDPYYSSTQWHLPKILTPNGWDITTGSNAVPIAILDTGVDSTHPDLSNKLLAGYNFAYGNTGTNDMGGHGTSVAGLAAAITNNATGVAGVAWGNPIMPLVIADSNGWIPYSNMANAITYATDHGVKIINMSCGGTSQSSTLQNAVNYAWNKGCVIVAAAGNDGTTTPNYPAACSNVVAVSATTIGDTLAIYSSYGSWIDIAAPGSSLTTTLKGGGYGGATGTSYATPIVSGLVALIMSANPTLSNIQVVDIMEKNADDLGTAGFDVYYGYGRINVYKSLLAATNTQPQPDTTAPAVSVTSPADGSTVSGNTTVSVSPTDDVGIVKVELYLNGSLYATDTTSPYNFSWDTTQYPYGTYYLQARAYDPSGNVGQSSTITVYVNNPADTIAPTVLISSPNNGSYVKAPQKISVTASDNVGVKVLELCIDGVLKSAVVDQSTLTYTWNIRKESNGVHVISVKGYDTANNAGIDSVTVYK